MKEELIILGPKIEAKEQVKLNFLKKIKTLFSSNPHNGKPYFMYIFEKPDSTQYFMHVNAPF